MRLFISSTNISMLPKMYSAAAAHASFAETMEIPVRSSSSVCTSPGSIYIWLPPIPAARSLMVTLSESDMRPESIASHMSSIVMTFVTLAGGSFLLGFWLKRTRPEAASVRMADVAAMLRAGAEPLLVAALESGAEPLVAAFTGGSAQGTHARMMEQKSAAAAVRCFMHEKVLLHAVKICLP